VTNDRLSAEIEAHEQTLAALRAAQAELEEKVVERTAQLENSNARLRVLMRETVHRSKNLLTVVQSLARQTARSSADTKSFLDAFLGRLNAMAGATDMVVAEEQVRAGEADMGAVVTSQLAHYTESFPEHFTIKGPSIGLRTEAAQQMGLILHELATNAMKYGALADDGGRIRVSWHEEGADFIFRWDEHVALEDVNVKGRAGGFGSGLLTRAIPAQLGGEAEFNLTSEGVRYSITVPRESLRPADQTSGLESTRAAYA
jgi:two-component sensor histidine kinase